MYLAWEMLYMGSADDDFQIWRGLKVDGTRTIEVGASVGGVTQLEEIARVSA